MASDAIIGSYRFRPLASGLSTPNAKLAILILGTVAKNRPFVADGFVHAA